MNDANRGRSKNRKLTVGLSAAHLFSKSFSFFFSFLHKAYRVISKYFIFYIFLNNQIMLALDTALLFYDCAYSPQSNFLSCSLFISVIVTERRKKSTNIEKPATRFAEFVTRICTVGNQVSSFSARISSRSVLLPCRFPNTRNDTCSNSSRFLWHREIVSF